MKATHLTLIACVALLVTSCIKEGYSSDCPGPIEIRYDWNENQTDVANDSLNIYIINGNDTLCVGTGSKDAGTDPELDNGVYQVVGSEPAKNVTTHGSTVSIETLPDGTATEPEDFHGGAGTLTVDKDHAVNRMDIPMRTQTRPLGIRVKIIGETTLTLDKIEGNLSGIALEREINYGFTPVNGKQRNPAIRNGHIRYTLLPENPKSFFSQKTLLGIDGNTEQVLGMNFVLSDGTPMEQTLDVTRQMDEFHTKDVTEPWIILLTIRLEDDPVSGKVTATITDWKMGTEDDLIAEEQSN